MNTFDLRLQDFQIIEIHGFANHIEEQKGAEFQASFTAEYLTDIEKVKTGDSFECSLNFKARQSSDKDPFFVISVKGNFKIRSEDALKFIAIPGSCYEVSSLLFPYLRSVSAPIIESLSQADIEFPLYLPELVIGTRPAATKPSKKAKKQPT